MGSYALRIEETGLHGEFSRENDDADSKSNCIEFSAGNPRIEEIVGIVHLYRDLAGRPDEEAALGDTLCCLAIPADMSVAEFCTFCGAYLSTIREMRVLRREAMGKNHVCMVLIKFDSCGMASSFLLDCNNKPFCSLEPEILCRLVRVRNIEILSRPRLDENSQPVLSGMPSNNGRPYGGQDGAGGTGHDSTGKPESRNEMNLSPTPTSEQVENSGDSRGSTVSNLLQNGVCPSPRLPLPAAAQALPQRSSTSPPESLRPPLLPPSGTTELPTCPVCLERLDHHISGVVTTVCNHQFHSECLQKWGDTSCPVCRYCSQPSPHASNCTVCDSNTDLWICLICGHVGCGRYRGGHAYDHFKSSQHCYALELETQRVWDYVGDNYVHRLIQSKTDGKLVEVPSPAISQGTSGSRMPGVPQGRPSLGYGGDEGMPFSQVDEDLKEAMVASKLDSIAQEYNHLLASQLDSQRQYFETLLSAAEGRAEQRVSEAEAIASCSERAMLEAKAQAKDSERKRQGAEKKLADATASLQRIETEKEFLRSLNETLLSNQKGFKQQLQASKEDVSSKDAMIKDLKDQVRDLMFFLEAQRVVEASGGQSDLHQATVLPVPEAPKRAGRQSKGK